MTGVEGSASRMTVRPLLRTWSVAFVAGNCMAETWGERVSCARMEYVNKPAKGQGEQGRLFLNREWARIGANRCEWMSASLRMLCQDTRAHRLEELADKDKGGDLT